MSFRRSSWRRSRLAGRPTSPSASRRAELYRSMGLRGPAGRSRGRGRILLGPVRSGCARPGHAARRDRPGNGPCTGCRWREINHVHVWKSLLERAGFTLADIPQEWEAFWSFWCDQVQPAVRKALGRDDIWGVGLPMSVEADDTTDRVLPVRRRLRGGLRDPRRPAGHRRPGGQAQAHQGDRQLHRDLPQGLHAARFGRLDDSGNNKAFLAQAVVMTLNDTLSIPNALKRERPEDYYKNTATIEWPIGAVRPADCHLGTVFSRPRSSRPAATSRPPRSSCASSWRGLARALARLRRRAHAAADAEAARAAVLARPERPAPHGRGDAVPDPARAPTTTRRSRATGGTTRSGQRENVWAKAVHRVAAEGISPEQAVDEAIARIKQILSE